MTLKEKLIAKCHETDTSVKGIELLIQMYMHQNKWTEEQSVEYALQLFENGTIEKIKFIGKDNKNI